MNDDLVLVDTSAWVEFYRGGAEESPVARELKQLITDDRVVTTEPVVLELSIGVKNSKNLNKLKETFKLYHMAHTTAEVWAEAAENGFNLKRSGLTVPTADLLISTAAILHRLPVMHLDKHFTQMKEILKLKEHIPIS